MIFQLAHPAYDRTWNACLYSGTDMLSSLRNFVDDVATLLFLVVSYSCFCFVFVDMLRHFPCLSNNSVSILGDVSNKAQAFKQRQMSSTNIETPTPQ